MNSEEARIGSEAANQAREQQVLTDALDDILEHRAVIEQAKGMLMLVYQTSAEAAFDTLRWRSQDTNTKLNVLAERLVEAFTAIGPGVATKHDYDEALMTAHTRIS